MLENIKQSSLQVIGHQNERFEQGTEIIDEVPLFVENYKPSDP